MPQDKKTLGRPFCLLPLALGLAGCKAQGPASKPKSRRL